MEQIVTSTPGFAKDENGRFHFQGAHSQSEYVIDGQTIPTRPAFTFSNSIDPGIAQGIEIIYGNVPASSRESRRGHQPDERSPVWASARQRRMRMWCLEILHRRSGCVGEVARRHFGYFGSVNGSKSGSIPGSGEPEQSSQSRRHVSADSCASIAQSADAKNSFRSPRAGRITHRDVANTYTQEAAGQDQHVRSNDENINAACKRIFSQASVLEIGAFGRFSKFRLNPSPMTRR